MPTVRDRRSLFVVLVLLVGLAGPSAVGASHADGGPYELNVPVLMYHRISCAPPDAAYPELWICPSLFDRQMKRLRDDGWRTITARRLRDLFVAGQYPKPKRFVVTIDDGAYDGYSRAAPILERYGFRATFFTVAKRGSFAARRGWLTWADQRDLVSRGHDVGNHSHGHADMTAESTDLVLETEGAQALFEANLGFRPATFAYPFGAHDVEAVEAVAAIGIALAFTIEEGVSQRSGAGLASPRIFVRPTDSPSALQSRMLPYREGH